MYVSTHDDTHCDTQYAQNRLLGKIGPTNNADEEVGVNTAMLFARAPKV